MASISDTSHAKNVTNLESLISAIITIGATYNLQKTALNFPLYKPY